MSKSILTGKAEVIRTESVEKNNSAARVGQLVKDVVAEMVNDNEAQSIDGVKTFAVSPVVPKATTNAQAQNKEGVEEQITGRQEAARSQSTAKGPTSKLMDDELKSKAIEISKKITKSIGNNLANPSEFTAGKYFFPNGYVDDNASWGITGYIPFSEVDGSLTSNFYAGGAGYNCLYDENKNFISSFQGPLATWTPGVAYVRYGSDLFLNSALVIVNVGEYILPHVPYTELNRSVGSEALLESAVTEDKIKDEAITSSKIKKGGVISDKLSDKAVVPVKTSFMEIGKNLFNLIDKEVKLGRYVNETNGTDDENGYYNTTGYISVIEGNKYTSSYKHSMAWYDADKYFILGSSSGDLNNVQVAPVGAFFVRYTVLKDEWNKFQVKQGSWIGKYEPYMEVIKEDNLPIFIPGIAMVNKTYVLSGHENSIYHKSYLERWIPCKHIVHGIGIGWNYRERYFRTQGELAGDLTISIYDIITLKLLRSKKTTVIVGNPDTNNGAKTIQVLGDSFTFNGHWINKANQLCPSLSFVGTRKSYGTTLKAEGRGGWTLQSYMENLHSLEDGFSPFLHPIAPYKYYGNTAFWKAVKEGTDSYGMIGFEDTATLIGFDQSTGRKTAPSTNDVQYVDSALRYERWNGTAWVVIAEGDLNFSFNYSKYLSTWGVAMPDIVSILLGVNDFCNISDTKSVFPEWKSNMDSVIASIKEAGVNAGKFVRIAVCLPMTETASPNNNASIHPVLQRANMYNFRELMIEAFDNYIYRDAYVDLVDTGVVVDGDYGFYNTQVKPFETYVGTVTETYSQNVPHPYDGGYEQLGISFAAYIQSVR